MDAAAADIIHHLGLHSHPEGGGLALDAGASLLLTVADRAGHRALQLGIDLAARERLQAVVAAHAWQQAEPRGLDAHRMHRGTRLRVRRL